MRDHLFLLSGILGLGALAMTVILAFIGPRQTGPLPPGFMTPVLAFEFAETEAEVYRLFEPDGSADGMDRLNRWDFLYMALYSSFLGTFALAAGRRTGRAIFYVAAALALIVLYADALENVQLLGLTLQREMDGGGLAAMLERLRFYTWLKWGGLALYSLLIGSYFRGLPGRWRAVGIVSFLPALLAVAALFRRGLPNELMALAIGILFLLLTVYALAAGRRGDGVKGV
ncbi:MAG: hypothetical protein KA170_01010 [Candidatus Promineofilum sp.]|nr:hypothetical protein [Promineifilum sp.]